MRTVKATPPGCLPMARCRVVLLLALAMAGAATAGGDGEPVSCGNVSPLGNQCPAGEVRLGVNPSAEVVVAPFLGRITIVAFQSHPDPPFFGRLTWTCDALGAAALTTCTPEPLVEGRVIPGLRSTVTCTASPPSSAPLVPPFGVWGCSVDPGSAPAS